VGLIGTQYPAVDHVLQLELANDRIIRIVLAWVSARKTAQTHLQKYGKSIPHQPPPTPRIRSLPARFFPNDTLAPDSGKQAKRSTRIKKLAIKGAYTKTNREGGHGTLKRRDYLSMYNPVQSDHATVHFVG
jgi:hypothetical protein